MRINELRQFAGLPEDPAFQDQLIGGKNLLTHSLIEAGIAEIVRGELGGVGADRILGRIGVERGGNRRIRSAVPSTNGDCPQYPSISL